MSVSRHLFRHVPRIGGTLVAVIAMSLAATSAFSQPVTVYAAGSLREVMKALEQSYVAERRSSASPQTVPAIDFLFGPSGKLRERIEAGEPAQIFASASPEHTDRLMKAGKLRSSNVFASNSLCVIARPGIAISEEKLLDTLLSPDVVLGTSTPGADPAGDYTWEMFRKIGAAKPGAFETLGRKAQKLAGAQVNAADTTGPYVRLLTEKRADVFVTYCTNAAAARKENPSIVSVKVPAAFDVATSYAIGLAVNAPDSAREFVRYVLSQRAQVVMAGYGFTPPVANCGAVEPSLREAHKAWTASPAELSASSGKEKLPDAIPGRRLSLGLHPAGELTFVPSADGKSSGTWGGVAAFTAPSNGHLEVFLDRRAWVDVVRAGDGKALNSIRSERWLGCAGVGKNLGFDVKAGERYELRLTRIDGPRVTALLMPMVVKSAAHTSK